MSEEKEEIKHLIKEYEIQFDEYKVEFLPITFDKGTYLSLKKALNLIDKLQKENAELKEDNKKLNDLLMLSELDYVSKEKIRELREIDNIDYLQFKLKELLGE